MARTSKIISQQSILFILNLSTVFSFKVLSFVCCWWVIPFLSLCVCVGWGGGKQVKVWPVIFKSTDPTANRYLILLILENL